MADATGVVVSYRGLAAALPAIESIAAEQLEDAASEHDRARLKVAIAQAQRTIKDQTTDEDVMVSPSDQSTALIQSFLADNAFGNDKLRPLASGGLEAKYDKRDLVGWLLRFPLGWLFNRRRERFRPLPDVDEVPSRLRIAMFGDWGTGMYGALTGSASIAAGQYDFVFHLGDVYYAGTETEFERNFVRHWPRPAGAVGRALNGNHEMYAGGQGYFNVGLPALEQSSSVVALRNDHWLILGLDTAYKDFDLGEGQAEWLQGLLEHSGDRKLILLSHHQPFSITGGSQGKRLQDRLARVLSARRVFAWYWGHEHVCAIYDAHPTFGLHGRCIGHGGIPEFRSHHDKGEREPVKMVGDAAFYRITGIPPNPSCLFLDGPNPDIPGYEERYLPHGYVSLDLDGPRLIETFHDTSGGVLHENEPL